MNSEFLEGQTTHADKNILKSRIAISSKQNSDKLIQNNELQQLYGRMSIAHRFKNAIKTKSLLDAIKLATTSGMAYQLVLCQYFICVWSISNSRAILCYSEINKKGQEGKFRDNCLFCWIISDKLIDQKSKSQKRAYWHNTSDLCRLV